MNTVQDLHRGYRPDFLTRNRLTPYTRAAIFDWLTKVALKFRISFSLFLLDAGEPRDKNPRFALGRAGGGCLHLPTPRVLPAVLPPGDRSPRPRCLLHYTGVLRSQPCRLGDAPCLWQHLPPRGDQGYDVPAET